MSNWRGNKGEWSEAYAFLRILCDPVLSSADSLLRARSGQYSVVKSVLFRQNGENVVFVPRSHNYANPETGALVELAEIKNCLPIIFEQISVGLGGGAFEVPLIQDIYQRLGLHSFKMSSQNKVDITLVLSSNNGMNDLPLGFSIKSQLGSPSTLLNASAATNIYYQVDSVEESVHLKEAELIHYRQILDFCQANKIQMKYIDYASQVFKDNLSFFGSDFPEFFAEIVRSYVSGEAKTRLLSELVVVNSNGARDLARREFQMKSFLRAVALGLVPNSPWDGNLKGYGGYLIVKDSGDLLCFLLENDDDFKTYLYLDTSLTTPKSQLFSKTTYEQGSARIALNAQIRFLK